MDFLLAVCVAAIWSVIGGYSTPYVMLRLRGRRPFARRWRTGPMGNVERSVYFGSTLANAPEVIAGWIVLKVASNWRLWGKTPGVFNTFTTGTGLNLAWGVCSALSVQPLTNGEWLRAAMIAFAPVAVSALILVHVRLPHRLRRLRPILDPELYSRRGLGQPPN